MNVSAEKTREPLVDGLFYPDDPAELEAALFAYENACGAARGKAFAIVTPHAAYEKAGGLMAAGFLSAADRKIRTVVLVGPVHRDHTDEIILPESRLFRVPTGTLCVDEKSLEALLSCGTHFTRRDLPHLEEHCLELQLPFVRRYFPGAKILPILLGRDTAANIKALGRGLYLSFAKNLSSTLFVVTTNLCEGGPAARARQEADVIIGLAEQKDAAALMEGGFKKRFTACGLGCLAALLEFPGVGNVRILGRASSVCDPDAGSRVEYAAMAMEASA
jgi:AmmeMemoRadiSam system protein B